MAQSHIRASDQERERVATFLRDQATEGRITADELDERVGRAYRAVTIGDLRRLVSDLPAPRVGPPARLPPRPRGLGPLWLALAFVLLAPVLLGSLTEHGLAIGAALVFVVVLLGVMLSPFVLVAAAVGFLARHVRARRVSPWDGPWRWR